MDELLRWFDTLRTISKRTEQSSDEWNVKGPEFLAHVQALLQKVQVATHDE